MHYYFINDNRSIVYSNDKAKRVFTHLALSPIGWGNWKDAISDTQGYTLILLRLFVHNYTMFGHSWRQLVKTERISKIEYINVVDINQEEFETMSDEEKKSHSSECVRIQLSDSPQSNIQMSINGDDFFVVPYADVRTNNVLAPERYLSKDIPKELTAKESSSKHISIVKYTGNAPDILIVNRDKLHGIDDIPSVLDQDDCPDYALKIDLNFWLPEGIQDRWEQCKDAIIYGSIPGAAGNEQRLNTFLNMTMSPPPPLIEQMRFNNTTPSSGHNQEKDKMMFGGYSFRDKLSPKGNINEILANHSKIIDFKFLGSFPIEKSQSESDNSDCTLLSEKIGADKRKVRMEQRKKLKLRQNFDRLIVAIFQFTQEHSIDGITDLGELENTTLPKLLIDLSKNLKKVLSLDKNMQDDIYQWFHRGNRDNINEIASIVYTILKINNLLKGDCLTVLEDACPECAFLLNSDYNTSGKGLFPKTKKILVRNILYLYSQMYRIKYNKEQDWRIKEANIRADEREQLLRDLSHDIKNIIVGIKGPIERVASSSSDDPCFDATCALNGANMISRIVWCINNSYKSTPNDFIEDIVDPSKDALSLEDIVVFSLRNAVANMFDKEYHCQFAENYFLDNYSEAYNAWKKTDDTKLIDYIKDYMANCKFEMPQKLKKILIGNSHGSATKLMIIVNELFINALKAVSFINDKEQRNINILIDFDNDSVLSISSHNNFKGVGQGTGRGRIIIENFIKSFNGSINYTDTSHIFHTLIKIPFTTKQKRGQHEQNLVC